MSNNNQYENINQGGMEKMDKGGSSSSIPSNQPVGNVAASYRIDSFFQSNKIVKAIPNEEKQKDLASASHKIAAEHASKLSRKRSSTALDKSSSNLETLYERDVEENQLIEQDSQLTNSTESNIPKTSSFNTHNSYYSSASSKKSSSKGPPLETQRNRIQQVKEYDLKNETFHHEVLVPTMFGISCEACGITMKDPSQVFRYKGSTNQISDACHLVTRNHIDQMNALKKRMMRQPALVSLLNDVTPNVDSKVKIFRFNLTKLFLGLGVSLVSMNTELVKEFVDYHIGQQSRYLSDRSNISKDYIPKLNELINDEDYKLLSKQQFHVQIDSTARVGEWYGFVFRTVNDNLDIIVRPHLRRLRGKLIERYGEVQLSSVVNSVVREVLRMNWALSEEELRYFVAITADRASINRCAFMGDNLHYNFPYVQFIDCHPHTLANCGKTIDEISTIQGRFWALHNKIFSRGETARTRWSEYANEEMVDHNNTRWFAKRDSKEYVR